MDFRKFEQLNPHWRINNHYLGIVFVLLALLSLTACSEPDINVIDLNNSDQIPEIKTSPTLVPSTEVSLTQAPVQAPIPFPPVLGETDEKIAFMTNRDGNMEIYLINADGSNQLNLTNNDTSEDYYPAWSPDGSKIAFTSDFNSDAPLFQGNEMEYDDILNFEIYVIDADGSNMIRLTHTDKSEMYVSWSPDGAKLVFEVDWDGTNDPSGAGIEIGMVDADGSNYVRLTNNETYDYFPTWSPDGSKIAFISEVGGDRDQNNEIFVINSDGSNLVRLTENNYTDGHPNWSPDGSQIVFISDRNGTLEICIMDADGSDVVCLPNHASIEHAYAPAWSTDGRKIAFSSGRHSGGDIYVMNADGSNLFRLTDNDGENYFPAWQP